MRAKHILILIAGLSFAACSPPSTPETSATTKPHDAAAEREQLRRALDNLGAYLDELESRLKLSTEPTWPQEATAARDALGNIRIELNVLRQGAQNVSNLDSWLADLENRLKGASTNNWNENAPAAQHIVGNLRIDLQGLRQGL